MLVFFGLAGAAVAALAYVFGDESSSASSGDVTPAAEVAIEEAHDQKGRPRRAWQLLRRALIVVGSAVAQVLRAAWPRVKEFLTNWVVNRVETHFAPALPP